jgi:hypothetical protein
LAIEFIQADDAKRIKTGTQRSSRALVDDIARALKVDISHSQINSIRKGEFVIPSESHPNRAYPKAAEDRLVELIVEIRKTGQRVYRYDIVFQF